MSTTHQTDSKVSQLLIGKYLNELKKLRELSGTHRESVVREAFKDLLKDWGRTQDLTFIAEYEIQSKTKERRYVDGALLHTLRVPFGYWEAKDEKDDLDAEIEAKFKRGYPKTNILFDDSRTAVLIQHGEEVMRCDVDDVAQLEKLLKLFFGYERPEIEAFRKAVEQFRTDLPAVLDALREMLDTAYAKAPSFRATAEEFLKHAQDAINPKLVEADVREMLIQHVLTGEIFAAVFPGNPFHEDNNVAVALHKLEATFFTGNTKFQLLKGLKPYYTAIAKAATDISTHHEKQTFLKSIYENFYKVYNPKAADRLGVVYTPNEVVRFMIESADWLCQQHFGRNLIDRNVDILDPATGTGTFLCELIEHFAGQPAKLKQKYLHELHANEVAILPYYVANLNIEATYAAATGGYEEFPGLCFVDTLDNVQALRKHRGHMDDIFGSVSDENIGRIKRQNSKTISVIIGNPPYNANQLNENENNKNREYPEIDKRIKETYVAQSTAQKTKVYDMYARFFRWASDRLDEKDGGIVAMITNRSFIESRTFDGFRKTVEKEFNEIRVLDLGGDVRANPKLSGTTHNVFGIQTGVAISFMVRKAGKRKDACRIFYTRRAEMETAEEKMAFLSSKRLADLSAEEIKPDKKGNWVNLTTGDFDSLIPIASKEAKLAKKPSDGKAIFSNYSLGISTNRDDWAYDENSETLIKKIRLFADTYHSEQQRWIEAGRPDAIGDFVERQIKWTADLEAHLQRGSRIKVSEDRVFESLYRPFVRRKTYFAPIVTHRAYQNHAFFPHPDSMNQVISISIARRAQFALLASAALTNTDMYVPDVGQCFPRYRYDAGTRIDNITDWSLDQFRKHYEMKRGPRLRGIDRPRQITKDAVFYYVYAVLHNPAYRKKYALNLKREFPRIPFYNDFWQWADWGKTLMDLHIGYESVAPFGLTRSDVTDEKAREAGYAPKALLKANREAGHIVLDSETTLSGVPAAAWDYRLGNRSALEWVLDQYKEKMPKDPTIRDKFNTYRFSDYKDRVIDLLQRVTEVSVRTQEILGRMQGADAA